MSQENIDAFNRAVEAVNHSDWEAFLGLLHPEVEWHTVLPMLGGDAVYWGVDGVRGMLEDVLGALASTTYEFPDIRDLGDRLIAIGHIRVIGEASGAAIDSPFAYVIEFRDGKPLVIRSFLDPSKALEAAGLRE